MIEKMVRATATKRTEAGGRLALSLILSVFFGILAVLAVYALHIEPRRFRFVRLRMDARRLFQGNLVILHLSDLHLRRRERAKLDFLRGLRGIPVDMVVITGDIIEEDSGIDACIELLKGFKPDVGIFVVFGAHDRWDTRIWNVVRDLSLGGYHKGKPNDFERFKRELEKIGVICLINSSYRVSLCDQGEGDQAAISDLWLVGVDDVFAGLGDFDKALDGVPPDGFRILLTHSIEDPHDVAALGFDAVFAGHSHGGQVRIPFFGPVITRSNLSRKYASGTFEVAGTPFHLNNGLGTGRWTGFRFLCPPEATLVELRGRGVQDNSPR